MMGQLRAVLATRGGHTHYQPTLYDAIEPFYWQFVLLWILFIDTVTVAPLTPLDIACICQEITHTVLATLELVTFGVEMPSHPLLWLNSGIHVSSSSDD